MEVVDRDWRGERRERLLEAATRVFARADYGAASMDEIAAEAGVGKPTLYRYFDGKAELFAAVFAEALDRLERRLEEVAGRETRVERRLQDMVAEMIPTFRDHLVARRVLDDAAAAIDRSKRRIFRERRSRIAAHLARAIDHPGICADPLRTAHLVIGMVRSGTAAIEASDRDIAAEITSLVLRGVAAPGLHRAANDDGRISATRGAPLDGAPLAEAGVS